MDLFSLHGKAALITGGSTGIGKRVALAYAQAGAQVAVAARHFDVLQDAAAEIAAAGGKVLPVACDVTQQDQVTDMVQRVTAELGGIDIAVCNAGILEIAPLLDMSLDDFQRIQDTGLYLYLASEASSYMTGSDLVIDGGYTLP